MKCVMLITPLKRFKILFKKKKKKKNHEERKYNEKSSEREEQNGGREGKKRGEWSVRCYKHGSGPGSTSYRTNGREQMIKVSRQPTTAGAGREDATVFQPSPPQKKTTSHATRRQYHSRVTSTWMEVYLKHKAWVYLR